MTTLTNSNNNGELFDMSQPYVMSNYNRHPDRGSDLDLSASVEQSEWQPLLAALPSGGVAVAAAAVTASFSCHFIHFRLFHVRGDSE